MINVVPENWKYNDSLEMLFLFYQEADELLSETTSDTYALPLHNTFTLIKEIEEIFVMLKQYDMIDKYYSKYIPPIIDEFFESLESDYIAKKLLGKRLLSIRTGFEEGKHQHQCLEGWINIFYQTCSSLRYREAHKREIVNLVTNTTEKNKLIEITKRYLTSLVWSGYSREYLYITTKRFFSNKSNSIVSISQINEYLNTFSCKREKHDFLILMDIESVAYMGSISDNLIMSEKIKPIDIAKERKELCKDYLVADLFSLYDKLCHQKTSHNEFSIVRFCDEALDPYTASISFCDTIRFLQTFTRFFKHHNYTKQVYKILYLGKDGRYKEIKLPSKMLKRPYVEQKTIDKRIQTILQAQSMDSSAFLSLTNAIEMHSEAFDSGNTVTLLRTFWTALETLFSNPSANSIRDNVVNSVTAIIQKTYILKLLRGIYIQVRDAIEINELNKLGITNFKIFVGYISSNSCDSAEMKEIYKLLPNNPLLRSRLYNIRKKLDSCLSIANVLENHKKRIDWQLSRLSRIRNIATHLGMEVSGADIAVNHLHNYFDFVVNYLLCRAENKVYTVSISTVVFEAKNDNRLHNEMLKSKNKLSADNYLDVLFGPDENLVNYEFEH